MIGCTLAGLTLEKTACYSSIGSSRETRENCAKSGTGEVGKEVLSFELETDGKNGPGEISRFPNLRTRNFELRAAPFVHVLLVSFMFHVCLTGASS